jgi:hypothetical protein
MSNVIGFSRWCYFLEGNMQGNIKEYKAVLEECLV